MSQRNKEKAIKFYPYYWPKSYIIEMVKHEKITINEYEEITGEEYKDE